MARSWVPVSAVAAALWGLILAAVGGSGAPDHPVTSRASPMPASTTPNAGYEAPDYTVIDTVRGDVEIRRYQEGQWVKFPVPGDDFTFMAEYGNERLKQFFEGENYEHKEVKKSTPLSVTFNLWDLNAQRFAQYWVPAEEE
ncbi:unnamed protein product, partial [Ostreobium quekettii]